MNDKNKSSPLINKLMEGVKRVDGVALYKLLEGVEPNQPISLEKTLSALNCEKISILRITEADVPCEITKQEATDLVIAAIKKTLPACEILLMDGKLKDRNISYLFADNWTTYREFKQSQLILFLDGRNVLKAIDCGQLPKNQTFTLETKSKDTRH